MSLVKKIAFTLFVIMLSSLIYFILVSDNKSKEDFLYTSLKLVGERFLATLAEGQEKEVLDHYLNHFLNSVKDNTVAPDKVEKIAATLLNMSNSDTIVSPRKAIAVIKTNLKSDSLMFFPEIPEPPIITKRVKRISREEKNIIANRLKYMYKLQTIVHSFPQDSLFKTRVQFRADSGLTVKIHNMEENGEPRKRQAISKRNRVLCRGRLERKIELFQHQEQLKEHEKQLLILLTKLDSLNALHLQ